MNAKMSEVHAAMGMAVLPHVENFIKQGWINRNNILVNGAPYRFTVPIQSVSSFVAINEVLCGSSPLPCVAGEIPEDLDPGVCEGAPFPKDL
jgi:hypothetical protein